MPRPNSTARSASSGASTVTEIARLAGVSVATVSRVMNDPSIVRAETAAAVRAAMEQVNYRPRGRGRARGGSSESTHLAFVTLGYPGEHWRSLPVLVDALAGANREASERGHSLRVEALPENVTDSPLLRDRSLSGALVMMAHHIQAQRLLDLAAPGLPIVRVMGIAQEAQPFDHVTFDNHLIGRVAFDYLAAGGCERFAFVTDQPARAFTRRRALAFVDAAAAAGKSVRHGLITDDAVFRLAVGSDLLLNPDPVALLRELLAAGTGTLGLFVPTDWEAVTFCKAIGSLGLTLGRDLLLISCDNEQTRLAALGQRPATIDIHPGEIGRLGVRRLLDRVARPDEPPTVVQIAPRLVLPD